MKRRGWALLSALTVVLFFQGWIHVAYYDWMYSSIGQTRLPSKESVRAMEQAWNQLPEDVRERNREAGIRMTEMINRQVQAQIPWYVSFYGWEMRQIHKRWPRF